MADQMVDLSVLGFKTYDEYIISFGTKLDFKYLGSLSAIANVSKLGYRSTKQPYDKVEFEKRLKLAMLAIQPKILGDQPFSRFMSPDNTDPILLEFKRREIPILSKALATIVFTQCSDSNCTDLSSYIDLGTSWLNAIRSKHGHTNWKAVFQGKAYLRPRPHHLSYYDARHNIVNYTPSDNFQCIHDPRYGLMFMHRSDHKYIPVGSKPNPYERNRTRTSIISPNYSSIVFYDHILRKKL